MALQYPPEWKFDDEADGLEVPQALRDEVYSLAEKVSRGADKEEGWVVQNFKMRFGNRDPSSTMSWAYSDLSTAIHAMENAAEFAEAFWLGVEDAREKGCVCPTLAQVNKLYAKHAFPFKIDPPHLRRTDQPPKPSQVSLEAVTKAALAGRTKSEATSGPTPLAGAIQVTLPPPSDRLATTALPVTTRAALAVPEPAPVTPSNFSPASPAPRSTLPVPAKPICFVAQPFREPFQGRFDEDIRPAIEAAGLTAYKVDEDMAADKLVEDIHAGIERASVVLVDITEDNPNVWYELGYSQALGKPLVMISCSSERPAGKAYPFDVRGRVIIDFKTGKRSAHDKLQRDVTERIKALLNKREEPKPPPPTPAPTEGRALVVPTAPADGVDEDTLLVIRIVLARCVLEEDLMPVWDLSEALESQGLSKAELAIAIRKARAEGYIQTRDAENHNGDSYNGVCLSTKGNRFVIQHPHLFKTERTPPPPRGGYGGGGGYTP